MTAAIAIRAALTTVLAMATTLAAAGERDVAGMPSTVRLTASPPVVDPALQAAYEALMAGDLVAAAAGYTALLRRDARSSDALHGLAATALRRGDPVAAEALLHRALDADPNDMFAYVGARGLARPADTAFDESRLKLLLAAQPAQHVLRFALGNLYAAQQRWHEAQQQYFLAHAGDPAQPDYLFNLAVALEHLRQPQLARRHYAMALAAAAARPATFDPTVATTSLRELPVAAGDAAR